MRRAAGAAIALAVVAAITHYRFIPTSLRVHVADGTEKVPPRLPSAAVPALGRAESAEQLVARVLDARRTSGFQIRATLTHTKGGRSVVRQLLMRGRRERVQATTLYDLVWPAEVAGRALVVREAGERQASGFLYQPGKVTRLTSATLAQPFFDSDLRIDDLAEGFWYWHSPTIVGEEAIREYRCAIVEFRPAADTPTPYSLVKAWVSPDLLVALRVEQFGSDGRLVKRIALYRMLKLDGRWWPAIVTVEPADGQSRTVIEGTKVESDLHLSAADFTTAALKKLGRVRE
jgi:outer membrane lipoprotein-sorting protein